MTNEAVFSRLEGLGVRLIEDIDVPVNGHVQELPCLAALPKTTVIGSDNGLVSLRKSEWQLILLTSGRDNDLNRRILAALAGCGRVTMEHFPDLSPYQTTFKFTTYDR